MSTPSATTRVAESEGLIQFTGGPRAVAVVIASGGTAKALPNLGRCRLVYIRALQANQSVIRLGGSTVVKTVSVVDTVWVAGDPTLGSNAPSGITLLAGEWFPFPIPAVDLESWYIAGNAPDGIELLAVG